MPYDDGKGPYTFCKRGRSRCNDQHCDCIDTAKYRAKYLMSREREGWAFPPRKPMRDAAFLALCMVAGAVAGLALLASLYAISQITGRPLWGF